MLPMRHQQVWGTPKAVDITPPHAGHEFTFDQAHEAIDCLRLGKTIGKLVLLRTKASIKKL